MFLQIAAIILIVMFLWILLEKPMYSNLPGPTRWPIIGSAFCFVRQSHSELFQFFSDLHKIHGPRYLIQLLNHNILHVCGVKDAEIILTHPKNIGKSRSYEYLQPWLGTGLLTSTGSKWHKRRKMLTPCFHFHILKNFMQIFQEHSKNLVNELNSQLRENSNVVNLTSFISDFTLFAICETVMGTQLDLKKLSSRQYKDAILGIGRLVLIRITNILLQNEFIFKQTSVGKEFYRYLKNVHCFANGIIEEKKRHYDGMDVEIEPDENQKLILLDLLLMAKKNDEIDIQGITDEVHTFIFEGHDTTAIAITFGLALLADHEDIQEKLFEEISCILGDSGRSPTISDFGEMPYLEAVLKEILRIYPSVPMIARQVEEDFMLDDILVKKGTEIVLHIYDIHRNPEYYPDPEAFKPERFLEATSKHPYAYLPFSAGPRNCIGQKFAKLEVKCFLCEIIRNFKLHPIVRGARPTIKADLVLRSVHPVYVKFEPR